MERGRLRRVVLKPQLPRLLQIEGRTGVLHLVLEVDVLPLQHHPVVPAPQPQPGRGPRESAERFSGERRSSGGSEACRIRRGEGSGACDDEVEEARAELYRAQAEKMKEEAE